MPLVARRLTGSEGMRLEGLAEGLTADGGANRHPRVYSMYA